MDAHTLIPLLMLATFAAVIAFAQWSKKRVESDLEDPNDPNSTLASDGPEKR